MTKDIQPSEWDALWIAFEQALAQYGSLSENATHHLLSVAEGLSTQGDWERAWRAVDIAQRSAANAKDIQLLALVFEQRGTLNHRKGVLPQAAADWEEALKLFIQLDQSKNIANTYSSLGIVYRSLGEIHKAQEYLEKALALAKKLEHRACHTSALNNLGLVLCDQGNVELATRCFLEALTLFREMENKKGEAGCLRNLGMLVLPQGNTRVGNSCWS